MLRNTFSLVPPVNPTNATQPSKAPQPSTEPKRIKEPKHMKPSQEPKPSTGRHRYKKGKKPVVDPVPSALMAGIADRLMEVKLSSWKLKSSFPKDKDMAWHYHGLPWCHFLYPYSDSFLYSIVYILGLLSLLWWEPSTPTRTYKLFACSYTESVTHT